MTGQHRTEQNSTEQHSTTQDRTGQKSGTWKVWNCPPHPPKREKQITKQRNKRNMSYFWFLLIHSLSSLFVYVMIWTLLFYIHSASRTQSIEIINNKIIKIYNNQWGPRWSCDCLGVWLMYYFMKYTLYDDNNLFERYAIQLKKHTQKLATNSYLKAMYIINRSAFPNLLFSPYVRSYLEEWLDILTFLWTISVNLFCKYESIFYTALICFCHICLLLLGISIELFVLYDTLQRKHFNAL